MLIVVAVVAAVVSFSWPSLRKAIVKSEVRNAARQLRDALARARLEAIESGSAQQFRYLPGTGRFELSARTTPEGGGAPALVAAEGFGDEDGLLTDEPASGETAERQLPEDVRFFDPEMPDVQPVEPDPLAAESQQGWSAPIIFYPNGRTFNTRIRLTGQRRYYVDVTLRGLTGAAKVGEVQRFEEETLAELAQLPLEATP